MTKTRATQDEREEHVQAWEASGLSSRAYAARAGINPNTLVSWRWQRRGRGKAKKAPPVPGLAFIELAQPGRPGEAGRTIELQVADVTVRVTDGFDPETLRRVIEQLFFCNSSGRTFGSLSVCSGVVLPARMSYTDR